MRSRRRIHRLLGTAVAVLIGIDGVAGFALLTRVSAVTVDEAVSRYRARTGAPPAAAAVAALGEAAAAPGASEPMGEAKSASNPNAAVPTRAAGVATPMASGRPVAGATALPAPPPGVYAYATTGFEEVAIPGGHHNYPATTTITLTASPCGVDVRWDGLDQRYDQWTTCAQGRAIAVRDFTTYHDFFSQVDRKHYVCTPQTMFRPDTDEVGATFRGSCASEDSAAELDGRVAGIETVVVAGRPVPAIHIRIDEKLTGSTHGTRASDSWYALADNLLLKRTAMTDADAKATFGQTHYHEELAITVQSLAAQR